ncbi:outer membrane receptor protein involved in Fe transport [Ancylobacter aquaticus]|uniref:Outer membrane receptor protein involved in Fe transport n=1 Tax=Ancylobacter aquaticus TaxID=100 RepID=A0A4R1HC67_ANCAQ|nr:TonB-dependent receptor [Ancylobacter aquaticus]TCK19614.1 outer membrane receptor protein involved in Fe transport [Ancylobacter aquaticus]
MTASSLIARANRCRHLNHRQHLLAGCALIALASVAAPSPGTAQTQAAAAQISVYAIPAGPVSGALAAFGAANGLQIVYDSSIAQGLRSPGVRGARTSEQALAELLAGTGLNWRFTSPRSVTIEASVPSTASVVVGEDMIELDAITISGEKLTRDLANVYSSVGVVTGEQFFDYAIEDLNGALNKLANTRVSGSNRGSSGIVIRGLSSQGLTSPTNSSPTIALIVDGASQNGEGIQRGNRGTWDVANVEVFRGPQSTLQGRNAMGGAVVVNTNDPTWHWEGAAEFDYLDSSDSGYQGSGAFMLSGPLAENQLAFRVAGQYLEGDRGIAFADPLNGPLDNDEFSSLRAKVLITPEQLDGFEALITVSYNSDKPGFPVASGPNFFDRRFNSDVSAAELRYTDVTTVIADVSQQLSEGVKLRSVTAYIETDADISSLPGSTLYLRDELRAGEDFTEDLRLELEEGVRPLSGVIGFNYGRFSNKPDSEISVAAPEYGIFDPILYQELDSRNLITSYAAYADLRYALDERWTVLFGGRLGYETVENQADGRTLNLFETIMTGIPAYESSSYDADVGYLVALPKIGIAYAIDPKQTVAFTVSEGFRAGFTAVDGSGNVYEVDPEKLWAYEVAYRSKWLDDRLEVNANGFYYKYSDLQTDVDDPILGYPQTITANVGKAHAYGGEIELRALVTQEFTAFASVGLLKTEFDSAVPAVGIEVGGEFPEAPSVTFNIGGIYRHASGVFVSADLAYTDSYYSTADVANTADEQVSAFTIVNAAIGYEAKNWSMTLFAKNIFDEAYLTGISVSGSSSSATVGDGRMIGVRARATF